MYGQHSDIDFQMIAVSVSLAAVHGEAHFVTARPNVYGRLSDSYPPGCAEIIMNPLSV